jgi:hypothetical protein
MFIPPISSNASPFPPGDNPLEQELQNLIMSYRTSLIQWGHNASQASLEQMEDAARNLETFMKDNRNALFSLSRAMGWDASGSLSEFAQFYNSTLHSIDNFLKHPNSGSADMLNEAATQLHWYITHINPAR